MGRPKGSPARMASLYVHGPDGLRGNWDACAAEAGFEGIPAKTDVGIRSRIIAEGGEVDLSEAVRPGELAVVPGESEIPAAEADEPASPLPDFDLPLPDDPDAAEKWKRLAAEALPVWRDVGLGRRHLSPTQRAVLQDIITRGYGKAGTVVEAPPPEADRPVVILPALSAEATLTVCPVCRSRLEADG